MTIKTKDDIGYALTWIFAVFIFFGLMWFIGYGI